MNEVRGRSEVVERVVVVVIDRMRARGVYAERKVVSPGSVRL